MNPTEIPFKAKFAGTCVKCSNKFPQHALIRKWGGKFAHAGCSKGQAPPPTPTKLLPAIKAKRSKYFVITDDGGFYPAVRKERSSYY
jgi:hypothetical protein